MEREGKGAGGEGRGRGRKSERLRARTLPRSHVTHLRLEKRPRADLDIHHARRDVARSEVLQIEQMAALRL